LVCGGSIIDGTVENSVISPGVVIRNGAVVRNSIVLEGSEIGCGSSINLAIIDKNSTVGDEAKIGYGVDFTTNTDHPRIMNSGVTLVGKNSLVPSSSVIGRNCLVRTRGRPEKPLMLPSGTTST
jgi:glucose-1-phosphate adenylyltransferase